MCWVKVLLSKILRLRLRFLNKALYNNHKLSQYFISFQRFNHFFGIATIGRFKLFCQFAADDEIRIRREIFDFFKRFQNPMRRFVKNNDSFFRFLGQIPKKVCRPFLCGGNPRNKNSSAGKPEIESAPISAQGPGTETIFTSFPNLSTPASTNLPPGSEIPGVPASDTYARFLPLSSSSIICSVFAAPEC